MTEGARTPGRAVAALALLVSLAGAGCVDTPDAILSVQDPDIINPSDVQSPAGANAVRIGAIGRLNTATTGAENMQLLGGLLADEWRSGDTFLDRDEIDRREISTRNTFLTDATRRLFRARASAIQAVLLTREYNPTAPAWHIAEMYFVMGYVENQMAEAYCSGIPFSRVDASGTTVTGAPISTTATLEMALAHVDSGLALIAASATGADDLRVRRALSVTKGRILVNLNRQAEAAAAVAGVPTTFTYNMLHSQTVTDNATWSLNNSARRYAVSMGEGINGIPFGAANDPRVPTCTGGDAICRASPMLVTQTQTFDGGTVPFRVQRLWPTRDASVTIAGGVEARLIEAEAQLKAGDAAASLATLNALRATVTGLTPLADAGSATARVDQLFQERAFWLFGRGHRLGDLRRLVRQYGRTQASVFPTGPYHKRGETYGSDVNFPIPQAEENNPDNTGCIDRNA